MIILSNKKPRDSEAGLCENICCGYRYLAIRFLIDNAISAIEKIISVEGSGT